MPAHDIHGHRLSVGDRVIITVLDETSPLRPLDGQVGYVSAIGNRVAQVRLKDSPDRVTLYPWQLLYSPISRPKKRGEGYLQTPYR